MFDGPTSHFQVHILFPLTLLQILIFLPFLPLMGLFPEPNFFEGIFGFVPEGDIIDEGCGSLEANELGS